MFSPDPDHCMSALNILIWQQLFPSSPPDGVLGPLAPQPFSVSSNFNVQHLVLCSTPPHQGRVCISSPQNVSVRHIYGPLPEDRAACCLLWKAVWFFSALGDLGFVWFDAKNVNLQNNFLFRCVYKSSGTVYLITSEIQFHVMTSQAVPPSRVRVQRV